MGRPTGTEILRRNRRLVQVAGRMFREQGVDNTSMEAIADAAVISKSTLYAHYNDKAVLFEAVLRQQIDALFVEAGRPAVVAGDVRAVLFGLARRVHGIATKPEAVSLCRTIVAVSDRFPDL
ncbi:TetR/AcrR family transcriptional regulator [Rhizobium leguminosarum]|uniref:TetR/AcrR family transcriptional regulator n=1 Tax=Rhizobium leguminosarum TaxID=384 RepID=UPI00103E5C0B|nr:TetR family transcriptional regulator [Rhizobium leguminosarum]TBY27442.1 TetR family transcriptional regulator [Rhizobium leguminosarum bv. viciae]